MNKTLLYRISSRGYPKAKVPGISKLDCLDNLQKHFHGWSFVCVADNCDQVVLDQLKHYHFDHYEETRLGNPGSFGRLYEIALARSKPTDIFYFVEDDYLHLPDAPNAIVEGLSLFDYVTLYDHPDKYVSVGMPLNPYAKRNRYSETTEVAKGSHCLWRTTNSTTMTFAVNGKTLKEDEKLWLRTKDIGRDIDFENFLILTRPRMIGNSRVLKSFFKRLFFRTMPRTLGVCVPGKSLHLELAYITAQDRARFLATQKT